MKIELPISKSIVNRLLVLQALRREDDCGIAIDSSIPDDVRLIYNALRLYKTCAENNRSMKITMNMHNCGTAMRFLTAFFAQKTNCHIVLDCDSRMRERPIQQLVDCLRELGADIEYNGAFGYPPITIRGKKLKLEKTVNLYNPLSTQFVSALMLIGATVNTNDASPYIEMTRKIINGYHHIEYDWSAAAFWYEAVAIYGKSVELLGLKSTDIQGDKKVVEIFAKLGVETMFTDGGIVLKRGLERVAVLEQDFTDCPDLYPAVYATCNRLGVSMRFSGVERLQYKESNRFHSMEQMSQNKEVYDSYADHRVAMALTVAGLAVNATTCISKSYPLFIQQWSQYLTI